MTIWQNKLTNKQKTTPNLVVVGESLGLEYVSAWLDEHTQINKHNHQHLSLTVQYHEMTKLNNKTIRQIANGIKKQPASPLAVVKMTNMGVSVSLWQDDMQVALDWHKLQKRIVSAGRKSELLLQAIKANVDKQLIDATAGFGHDGLILASTGARVTLVESHPVMAMLLLLEKQRMSQQKNWQALMGRLNIVCADAVDYLTALNEQACDISAIYLDPMFPNDSHDAKVGKHMQILHKIAHPPTASQESLMLTTAINAIHHTGRVVVKRPKNAPYLAGKTPFKSWHNDALRFDGYLP